MTDADLQDIVDQMGAGEDVRHHKVRALIAEVKRLRKAGYEATIRLFDATHDLRNGRRVCRICYAEQYDYSNGHAPGCEVAAAMTECLEILR